MNDPEIVALAEGSDPGPRPKLQFLADGRTVVTYSRTRFHLDRDGWELLPEDGVFLPRIRKVGQQTLTTFAFTKLELEEVFGHVCRTHSWNDKRCYHYPNIPAAARRFCVPGLDGGVGPQGGDAARHSINDKRADVAQLIDLIRSLPANTPRIEWARKVAEHGDLEPESQEYLERIHQWRATWRPRSIRVLLLAESHVAEMPGDLAVRLRPHPLLNQLPGGYARIVYCLGYGEPELCVGAAQPNRGTHGFWELLGQLATMISGCPPRKHSEEGIFWKLRVLSALREAGVWLEDASIIGIYRPVSRSRLKKSVYEAILQELFQIRPARHRSSATAAGMGRGSRSSEGTGGAAFD